MYKKKSSIITLKRSINVILILFFIILQINGQSTSGNNDFNVDTIVIDPGHGGKDPGTVGAMTAEKDIVLAISLKLGQIISTRFSDVKVIYTRETDEYVPLHKRAEIANKNNADLLISVHANGMTNKDASGTETFVLGLHRAEENFEVAKRENSVILLEEDYSTRYEGFNPESPETYIMLALMQKVYFDHSINFATYVQDQFRDRAKRKDRGVKQQGLIVLAQSAMPAVLVEVGFITNAEEEKYLMSEAGQDYIASAIFRAFRDYKNFIESRNMSAQLNGNGLINNTGDLYAENEADETEDFYNDADTDLTAPSLEDSTLTIVKRNPNIIFKVQISASTNPVSLSSEVFSDFSDVCEYYMSDIYKYAVGNKETYEEIVEYSKWVKNRFPDAFIIAVKNDKIIPLSKALKELKSN